MKKGHYLIENKIYYLNKELNDLFEEEFKIEIAKYPIGFTQHAKTGTKAWIQSNGKFIQKGMEIEQDIHAYA